MNWFKDIVTGIDGVSYDIVRVLALVVVLDAILLITWRVLHDGQAFDLQSYGIGFGAIFVTVGVALNLKSSTEPSLSIKSETTTTETVK